MPVSSVTFPGSVAIGMVLSLIIDLGNLTLLKCLLYTTYSQDYAAIMPLLLTIAYNEFKTIDDTLSAIQSYLS